MRFSRMLPAIVVAATIATGVARATPPSGVELKGSDTKTGDEFGYVTALSANTLAVGAPYHPGGGRVYIFVHHGNRWKQTQILKGHDTSGTDVFGVDLKISGSEMIVGADQVHGTGGAYIFVKTAQGWKETAELGASDLQPGQHAGLSVAISGSNAIMSTEDDQHAYIYSKTGATWKQVAELTGSDTTPGDEFGFWVGIDGTTAAVGADKHGGGAVYIFNRTAAGWTQAQELTPSDLVAGDHFGQNLAIAGKTLVVNAPYHNNSQGDVYVFTRTTAGWSQSAELVGSGIQNGNWFGWYVATDGSRIALGAEKTPPGGSGYVFTGSGATWRQLTHLHGADVVTGDAFGASAAVLGNTVAFGAFLHQGGRVYVFTT